MSDDEALDHAAAPGSGPEEQPRQDAPRRLKIALACSAVAGLVLIGDFVRQADDRAESAAAARKARPQRPPRHTKWSLVIPWIISLLSMVALIIVLVVTL
jgi:hypothetical protein